jgi:hypothetical protein
MATQRPDRSFEVVYRTVTGRDIALRRRRRSASDSTRVGVR